MKTLYCLGNSEMSYISFSLLCFLLYYTLLYSTVLYSTQLYSTLLYTTLFYTTVLYSALRYSTLQLLESAAAMVPDAANQKLEFSGSFSYQLLISEPWSSGFSEHLSVVWSCMNCVWTVVDVCVGQLSVPPQVAQTVGPQRHQLLMQRLLRTLQRQRYANQKLLSTFTFNYVCAFWNISILHLKLVNVLINPDEDITLPWK